MDNKPADIITLAGKFKDHVELRKYCDQQFITLQKAAEKVSKLEAEVSHLQTLLEQTTKLVINQDPNGVQIINKSAAEIICEKEIEKLNVITNQRPLTMEETKQLDIYIRGIKTIKQFNENSIPTKKAESSFAEAELINIASTQIEGPKQ